jgi:hypothetical protein
MLRGIFAAYVALCEVFYHVGVFITFTWHQLKAVLIEKCIGCRKRNTFVAVHKWMVLGNCFCIGCRELKNISLAICLESAGAR